MRCAQILAWRFKSKRQGLLGNVAIRLRPAIDLKPEGRRSSMSAKRLGLAAGAVYIALVGVTRIAGAEEKRVVDQLLDILRKNKQISERQYQDLKSKAED